ncbi:ABC transporter permease subunit [Catellatospora chokoriensis]|uniref:Transporter n=1 Tax=Catellatospora chokoriensis TaxID=310353 RepID=A0A8J3K811_9ACTN|nr:ABC transporter permease subunit [Catellatospora chokoriensis]GIF91174.1 transporter [Catellatospora chokoriensis]
MWWVTWRQHRAELLVAVLLLACVAVPLLITGTAMHAEYTADGIAACVANPDGAGCGQLVSQFLDRHTEWGNRFIWASVLPVLAGVFIGAPLLAREFEQGTWRLAFTQSVTRTRWLVTRLVAVGAGVAALAMACSALFTWWRAPLDAIGGRMRTTAFVIASPSLVAVTLFAFAAGVFAGALLRRTIAAMGATLAVYLAVRLPMEEAVRPYLLTPLVRITEPGVTADTGWRPDTEWVVADGWIDATGHRLSTREERAIVREVYGGHEAVYGAGTPIERYLAEHGLRHYAEYHPGSSFLTMQLVESAVFVGLAAALLAGAVWLVRRRKA